MDAKGNDCRTNAVGWTRGLSPMPSTTRGSGSQEPTAWPLCPPVGGITMVSKDALIVTPKTCDCVTSPGKRDFANVIKDLEMGLSWMIQVALSNHQGPPTGEAGGLVQRFEGAMLLALKTEEGDMNQGVTAATGIWKRQGRWFSPKASRRNAVLFTP